MRTIHTSMTSTFSFEFIASFECETLTILTVKCISHGYMYCLGYASVIFLFWSETTCHRKLDWLSIGNPITKRVFVQFPLLKIFTQAAAFSGRGLHKTRTPRINGTKSMFTAYSTHGWLRPRLVLAEEFWAGLIQAAA